MNRARIEVEQRADGSILMRNRQPLETYPRVITERFATALNECPARIFLGERDENGVWQTITYAEAEKRVRALGQALLDSGLSRERPLAILSAGSVAHALMALAASHVGIPYCPVSPAYSLVADSSEKLGHVIDVVRPGMVFVENCDDFAPALVRINESGFSVVAKRAVPAHALSLAELLETAPTAQVNEAHRGIAPDDTRYDRPSEGCDHNPQDDHSKSANVSANISGIRHGTSRGPVLAAMAPYVRRQLDPRFGPL